MQQTRILVVGGLPEIVSSLRAAGHVCHDAATVPAAVELAEGAEPHLVLFAASSADAVYLPRLVRAVCRPAPQFIALGSPAGPDSKSQLAGEGVLLQVVKEVEPAVVLGLVTRVLAARERPAAPATPSETLFSRRELTCAPGNWTTEQRPGSPSAEVPGTTPDAAE